MSIFDMFKQAPAVPAPQQQAPADQQQQKPANPGSIPDQQTSPTSQTEATDANGVVPNSGANAGNLNSPLAEYAHLWETKPNEDNLGQPAAPTGLNPEELQKAMSKADFSSAMTPEIMQAISAGGEGAATALMQALNNVARQSMTQNTLINEKLTAQAVQQAITAMEARIPNLVKDHSSASHVSDSNPLFSNPAIKPVIDATRTQLRSQFPNDTAAQTTEKLNAYLKAMGETFNPAPAAPKAADDVDWSRYLEGNS